MRLFFLFPHKILICSQLPKKQLRNVFTFMYTFYNIYFNFVCKFISQRKVIYKTIQWFHILFVIWYHFVVRDVSLSHKKQLAYGNCNQNLINFFLKFIIFRRFKTVLIGNIVGFQEQTCTRLWLFCVKQ